MDFFDIRFDGLLKSKNETRLWKYPLEQIYTVPPMGSVETILWYPPLVKQYDQGSTPRCAAFAGCWGQSILNSNATDVRQYDPGKLYLRAQALDGFPGAHDGTTLDAIGQALIQYGLAEVIRGVIGIELPTNGIKSFYWGRSIDAIRSAVGIGLQQVTVGSDWHRGMIDQQFYNDEQWILRNVPADGDWGEVLGGHAYTIIGASDSRRAFLILNSWGPVWPPAWISYDHMARLINDGAEIMVVFDKPGPGGTTPPGDTTVKKFRVSTPARARTVPSDASSSTVLGTLPAGLVLTVMATSPDANGRGNWYQFNPTAWVAGWLTSKVE